jgi:hypothetical protein
MTRILTPSSYWRFCHFESGGKIYPQLKANHFVFMGLGHLLMHNPAAGCHPLNIAIGYTTGIADAVFMVHMTADHVGYRFNSAVRMHGKALHVIRRILGSEMIEQQKGIDMIQLAGRDTSNESHPGTFHDRPGLNDLGYFSGLVIHFFS